MSRPEALWHRRNAERGTFAFREYSNGFRWTGKWPAVCLETDANLSKPRKSAHLLHYLPPKIWTRDQRGGPTLAFSFQQLRAKLGNWEQRWGGQAHTNSDCALYLTGEWVSSISDRHAMVMHYYLLTIIEGLICLVRSVCARFPRVVCVAAYKYRCIKCCYDIYATLSICAHPIRQLGGCGHCMLRARKWPRARRSVATRGACFSSRSCRRVRCVVMLGDDHFFFNRSSWKHVSSLIGDVCPNNIQSCRAILVQQRVLQLYWYVWWRESETERARLVLCTYVHIKQQRVERTWSRQTFLVQPSTPPSQAYTMRPE